MHPDKLQEPWKPIGNYFLPRFSKCADMLQNLDEEDEDEVAEIKHQAIYHVCAMLDDYKCNGLPRSPRDPRVLQLMFFKYFISHSQQTFRVGN